MSDSRAQTLASLDAFLDAQRQLLAQTQSDLHKLSRLHESALEHPEEFLENLEQELEDPAFKLGQYAPGEGPHDIDWDLFTSLDPSPFSNITIPGPPPMSAATKQRSAPSELQKFVREASERILGDFKPFVPEEEVMTPDADAETDDEQRLAELVKSGKGARQPHQVMELDLDEPPPRRRRVGSGLRLKPSREMVGSDTPTDVTTEMKGDSIRRDGSLLTENGFPGESARRPKRSRRPTARADELYRSPIPPTPPSHELKPSLSPGPLAASAVSARKELEQDISDLESNEHLESDGEPPRKSRVKKKAKQKEGNGRKAPSETFNLPWSVSEQHLLEKLLEEIPAGETHRWAKISKAMAGRRTARQVASRVQKYFEKLKKFGVGPD